MKKEKILTIKKGDKTVVFAETAITEMLLVGSKTSSSNEVYASLSVDWLKGLYTWSEKNLKESGIIDFKLPNGERIEITKQEFSKVKMFFKVA